MPFTTARFAEKVRELRMGREVSIELVANSTGIDVARLTDLEDGGTQPTGDEILILADHFKCDFGFLVEDEAPDRNANLRPLFRAAGDRLGVVDRYAVADFLFLCSLQAFLDEVLNTPPPKTGFRFVERGTYRIGQGIDCAKSLRDWLRIPHDEPPPANLYGLFRSIGIRVFRRALPGSPISGLFVEHPEAGRCVLVNGTEDLYRQRFSTAHECGHALMDVDKAYNLSEESDVRSLDLIEVRASAFASELLAPAELLRKLGSPRSWEDPAKLLNVAGALSISVPALLAGLKQARLIDNAARDRLRDMALRLPDKQDPEITEDMAPNQRKRMRDLLDRGLNVDYVRQCFDAYAHGEVSQGKVAEMLLVDPRDLSAVAELFRVTLRHA